MNLNTIGQSNFVTKQDLWSDDQKRKAAEIVEQVEKDNIEIVRFSFADQHGILRGKSVLADGLEQTLQNGCSITTTLILKDTSHRTVFPVWTPGGGFDSDQLTGAADMLMVADPMTFKILPWAPDTAWVLCDLYFPDGTPIPFSTRRIGQNAVAALADAGYEYVTGLEVEFHIFKLQDAHLQPEHATQPGTPPEVSIISQGFQYLTENRLDEVDPILEILRKQLRQLELPLRTIEIEFGPSQCEFTLHTANGMGTADNMMLFRSAVKQICQRNGYHATFMCRPALPNLFSSGWHLHQSLLDETGENVLMPADERELLSDIGKYFVAGLLEHARASCAFSTPTINGYKRYRPYALAPDKITWGRDNRGAMLRVIGGINDPATRIENRAGEPAANPYLFLASQIYAGLDGIDRKLMPQAATDSPYEDGNFLLPRSLMEAVDALQDSELFEKRFGQDFIKYFYRLKRFEISRFLSEVTDWEHKEYFQAY